MTPDTVLKFWLADTDEKQWYTGSATLDAAIRDGFLDAWQGAGALTADWTHDPRGSLAALILTDQFPRNMFRGDARSFATDPLARRIADAALDAGHDMATEAPARQFFYMPFEHSEDLADQHRAVALFAERLPGENLRHARLHRDAIAAFGRFPWRNAALGRDSTPAEQALLDIGGYSALVTGKAVLPVATPPLVPGGAGD